MVYIIWLIALISMVLAYLAVKMCQAEEKNRLNAHK